jgi:abortive infection bacteriophage resistance protein
MCPTGGQLILRKLKMEVKSPKTYEEQIEILRSHGCIVSDSESATAFLQRTNYYRFSGYLIAFKHKDGNYTKGTTFEKISSIYAFDQDLRIILLKALSEVEITVKSIIGYHFAHSFGALGYIESDNFNEKHDHNRFIERFDESIKNNKSTLIVKHHLKKYDGEFPIWVATELFTMGMISLFYADLNTKDKKVIAKSFTLSIHTLNRGCTVRRFCVTSVPIMEDYTMSDSTKIRSCLVNILNMPTKMSVSSLSSCIH